jgi:AmmeMemoRadiSam system protein B
LAAVRKPAVAGQFYEGTRESLAGQIEECFLGPLGPGRLPEIGQGWDESLVGIVSPHAGYMYSGQAAAHGFDRLAAAGTPDVAVILGVNHRGLGALLAVDSSDGWQTPLGDIRIDRELAGALTEDSDILIEDSGAHAFEHSLEVQVPFLQFVYRDRVKIVPIVVSVHPYDADSLDLSLRAGEAIGRACAGAKVVLIASTDFTHQEPQAAAAKQDRLALDRIAALDAPGLLKTVRDNRISMCGAVPTAIAIVAANLLGAKRGLELTYYTSGDVIGDKSSVVGYGALSLER